MPFIQADEVVRVALEGDIDGTDQIVNVFQFKKTDVGVVDAEDAVEDFIDILDGVWQIIDGIISVLTVMRRIRVQNLSDNEVWGTFTLPAPLPGAQSGDLNAQQVTAPMSFLTSVPRVILRKDWGVLAEGSLGADGRLTAGAMTIMANTAAALLTTHVETHGTYEFGFLSPKAAGFVIPTAATFTNIPGTRRSRRAGRGV